MCDVVNKNIKIFLIDDILYYFFFDRLIMILFICCNIVMYLLKNINIKYFWFIELIDSSY